MKYSGFHRALEIDHRAQRKDSWQIHICNQIETDRLDQLRAAYKTAGLKAPSYTAMVLKAIAMAVNELRPKYPEINSYVKSVLGWRKIHIFPGISAGCSTALDTEEAVVVGVVLEPHLKELGEITQELASFSKPDSAFLKNALVFYRLPGFLQSILHWFSKTLADARYRHRGTFGLNPVGKFGVDYHLSLPQTSCLQFGMGTVRERPVSRAGQVISVNTFYLTVSFDRRLMNGRPASILMDRVRQILNAAEFTEWERFSK